MDKIYKQISFAIAVLGTALAFYLLLQDRSVFLDEANLIRNIFELTFGELAGPLKYDQSAPFLFTWLTEAVTSMTGTSSISFRLLPLVMIVSSIWLLRSIVLSKLSVWTGSLILLMYTFHELTMRYATECKQYGADMFVTILLLYTALLLPPKSMRQIISWVLLGSFCIWLSMPAVITLTGIGCYWLVQYRNQSKVLIRIVLIGIFWLLAFALNYSLVLSEGINSEHMQTYHSSYFLNVTDISELGRQLLAFIRLVAKKTAVGLTGTIILLGLGIFNIGRHRSPQLLLYLLPIVLTAALSTVGLYSLIERMLLFLLPVLLLVVGYGIDLISHSKLPKKIKIFVIVLFSGAMLLAAYHRTGIKWISTLPMEDLKTAILQIQPSTSPIFLSKHAAASYHFYSDIHPTIAKTEVLVGNLDHNIVTEINLASQDSMWVILSHIPDLATETAKIISKYDLIKRNSTKETNCLLITKSQ